MSISLTKKILILGIGVLIFNLACFFVGKSSPLLGWRFYIVNIRSFFDINQIKEVDPSIKYNLNLSSSDLRMIKSWELSNKSEDLKDLKFMATLCNQKKCSAVQVRSKGDLSRHWVNFRKSYKLKFDDHSFMKADKVSLTIANDRYYEIEVLAGKIAKLLGLPILESSFLVMTVNKSREALYHVQKEYTKINMEYYLKYYKYTVKMKNIWLPHLDQSNIGTFYYGFKDDHYFFNSWRLHDQLYTVLPKKGGDGVKYRWSNALKCLRKKCKDLRSFFDYNHFAKWFSIISVFGSYHSTLGDNLIFIYNSATKKFSPIVNDVLIRRIGNYKKWQQRMRRGNFFISSFVQDSDFNLKYKKYLNDIVAMNIIRERKLILENYGKYFYKTDVARSAIDHFTNLRGEILFDNLKEIKKEL